MNALADELPVDLSRIAIHRRFTAEACDFMQAMMTDFMALLKTEGQAIKVEALNYFTAVNIINSTSWKLPAGLAAAFPGYHTAGCKVQLMFDYLTGTVNLIDIIELVDEIQHLNKLKISLDWNVWVGNKTYKTKVRLIHTRMPEEIANRRRQAAKLKASKTAKKPAKKPCVCVTGDYGSLISLNHFIT